jgi:hypothetical protein
MVHWSEDNLKLISKDPNFLNDMLGPGGMDSWEIFISKSVTQRCVNSLERQRRRRKRDRKERTRQREERVIEKREEIEREVKERTMMEMDDRWDEFEYWILCEDDQLQDRYHGLDLMSEATLKAAEKRRQRRVKMSLAGIHHLEGDSGEETPEEGYGAVAAKGDKSGEEGGGSGKEGAKEGAGSGKEGKPKVVILPNIAVEIEILNSNSNLFEILNSMSVVIRIYDFTMYFSSITSSQFRLNFDSYRLFG